MFSNMSVKQLETAEFLASADPSFYTEESHLEVVWTVIPCKKSAIILEHKMPLDWINMKIKTMNSWD